MNSTPPLHDWRRHHPTARRIARQMAGFPELAALRYRTLIRDVREKFGVGVNTASVAVRLFREGVQQ